MADTAQPGPMAANDHDGGTRRDFLSMAATAVAGIGAACAVWPLISSMNPARDTLAAGAPVDVDISKIDPGQQIIVLWRSRPTFIVRRTPEQQNLVKANADAGALRDPNSDANQQPTYAKNVFRSVKPEYLVLVGICTHLGCIPEFVPQPGGTLGPSWQGGFFCPCHGSRYDLSGRVFQNVPAPYNLPVPPYHFVSDTMVRVGENPSDSTFDFNSIEQI
jgi:ubiquinol-cytochrome c reductase iron-sulfur subunit